MNCNRKRLEEARIVLDSLAAYLSEALGLIGSAEELIAAVLCLRETLVEPPPPAGSVAPVPAPQADEEPSAPIGVGLAAFKLKLARTALRHLSPKVVPSDIREAVELAIETALSKLRLARRHLKALNRQSLDHLEARHELSTAKAQSFLAGQTIKVPLEAVLKALAPAPST